MGRARAALTGVALAVVVGLAAAGSAAAAPQPVPAAGDVAPAGVSTAAADGKLYAYEHAWFEGDWCSWLGDHGDWRYVEWNMPNRGDCSWWGSSLNSDFNDQASSLWNNGIPGGKDDVKLWKDITWSGPSMCLGNGDYWADLNLGWERFSDGSFANDQISSHAWVRSC